MIYLYSGTPGSGKSYHATYDIFVKLKRKKKNNVIANFAFDTNFKGCKGKFVAKDTIELDFLYQFAKENHKFGVEGQTLVVFDEAQLVFNSRDWNDRGEVRSSLKKRGDSRMHWIKFLSQHRKLGYNVIMVAHNDKMIDKQIRALIEYDIKHIKVNNGFFAFLPFTSFLTVEKWYGQNLKLGNQFLVYRPKIANLYDSYRIFDGALGDDINTADFMHRTAFDKQTESQGVPLCGGACDSDASAKSATENNLSVVSSSSATNTTLSDDLLSKFKAVFKDSKS